MRFSGVFIFLALFIWLVSCGSEKPKSEVAELESSQTPADNADVAKAEHIEEGEPVEPNHTIDQSDSTKESVEVVESEFFERSLLNKGDSIMLYGGDFDYLGSTFGQDTLFGRVIEERWSKVQGSFFFIRLEGVGQVGTKALALYTYYWDTKRGYKESELTEWERCPTDEEQKLAIDDMFFTMKFETVEKGLRFRNLH